MLKAVSNTGLIVKCSEDWLSTVSHEEMQQFRITLSCDKQHSNMNKPVSLSAPSLSTQGGRRGVHRHSPEHQAPHILDPVGERGGVSIKQLTVHNCSSWDGQSDIEKRGCVHCVHSSTIPQNALK